MSDQPRGTASAYNLWGQNFVTMPLEHAAIRGLLFTTDCRYSRPKISGDSLRICVKELGLMKGHPVRTDPAANLVYIPRCHFLFGQVSSSVRTLTPYIGDPMLGKFGQRYEEQDGPFSEKANAQEYAFEGRLEDPYAWTDRQSRIVYVGDPLGERGQ